MTIRIIPSILAADFAELGTAVREAEQGGADAIQIDVMDGHFVPNLTIGAPVVAALRKVTTLTLDVHLMIENPGAFVEDYARAGADILTVHVEACPHLHRVVQQIKGAGMKAGVALNPATPLVSLENILEELDLVLLMTVNPGFGGQQFIKGMLPKISRLRGLLEERGLAEMALEVDGGVNEESAPLLGAAGATWLVAGSAVYGPGKNVAEGIRRLRALAEEGRAQATKRAR
ncbi:MAG: ribulose-phosphate 3-epimerase [Ardenticatenales bacterium]|nr:ribulose-phosphate 3-epimerase [Ardenticatenales bacterium]